MPEGGRFFGAGQEPAGRRPPLLRLVLLGRPQDRLLQQGLAVVSLGQGRTEHVEVPLHFVLELRPRRRVEAQHRQRQRRQIAELPDGLLIECLERGGAWDRAGFSRRRRGVSKSALMGAKVITNDPGVCSA